MSSYARIICMMLILWVTVFAPSNVLAQSDKAKTSGDSPEAFSTKQSLEDLEAMMYRPNKHDAVPIIPAGVSKPTQKQIKEIMHLYVKELKGSNFNLDKMGTAPIKGFVLKSAEDTGFVGILFHHPEQTESMRSMVVLWRPSMPMHFFLGSASGMTGTRRTLMMGRSYVSQSTFIREPADGLARVSELRNLQPRAEASCKIMLTPVERPDENTVSVRIGGRTLILKPSFHLLQEEP